jgi:transcriptional regulator with XRE-family HTH domain
MRGDDRRTWTEYFADELRHWRDFRGMSQLKLSEMIHYSDSAVAMVETAQRKPRPEFVERCDEALGTGGALKRLLDELVTREVVPDWLDRWRQIEERASAFNSFQLFVIPGLLQTPDYARAILQAGRTASHDIEAQVQARLGRQRILTRDDPPMVVAVMDENALRRPIGGTTTMRDQLTYQVELSERPNIVLQVIPQDIGAYAGLTGPFVIATMDGDEFLYQDAALSGHMVEDVKHVAAARRIWDSLRADALPRAASLALITEVAEQWA